jgi:hypothetical protein
MEHLKREFLLGFAEGWSEMMSPFRGLGQALKRLWTSHLTPGVRNHA